MSIISEEILKALIGTFCKELFTKLQEPAVDAGKHFARSRRGEERLGCSESVGTLAFSLWDVMGWVQWRSSPTSERGSGYCVNNYSVGWIPGQM